MGKSWSAGTSQPLVGMHTVFSVRTMQDQWARDIAIKTNTAIIVAVDGKPVRITAAELIKMR
jgi:hypothetical protein